MTPNYEEVIKIWRVFDGTKLWRSYRNQVAEKSLRKSIIPLKAFGI